MLTLGKLGAGPDTGRYYVRQVASGLEDYYAGEGEAPGVWVGTGAQRLGLAGRVQDDELLRLLAAQHPLTGDPLGRPLRPGAVAGFDLTFKAPKSVGVLFGIADRDLSAEVRDGHEAAVRDALGYLERNACIVRRGPGGRIQLRGQGFVAAAFRHRTSRDGDPLLHTHVVVANHALGPDGRRTALYGRAIYAHAKTAGYVYQASLRAELTDRLGVSWEPVHNGAADITGIRREIVELFSQRRAAILQTMRERGEHSARAAQIAALDTRRHKAAPAPQRGQRDAWRQRAAAHGLDHEELRDLVCAREPAPALTELDHAREVRRLLSADGLTARSSTFDRRDVIRALAEHARHGDRAAPIEARADALLAHRDVVRLTDGRYSTRELLELEANLLAGARSRSDGRSATATPTAIAQALARRPSLSPDQCRLVEQLTGRPGDVQVVLAPAGTGKTFALDAAREAWERSGVTVLGCALSARAACELREQAAVNATTIARLRHALDRGTYLQPGSVLIVDEAGMVGTRDLAALADAAAHADVRLILVGDDRQLPEIEAGGAFRALARQQPGATLTEVRRQRDEWDRQALAELRHGDLEQFARSYLRQGRLVLSPTATAARAALVSDWWQAAQNPGEHALMIANRRADVADLNQRARTLMRADHRIGSDDVLQTEHRAFAIGDRVIATHNDRRLAVHNGHTGVLTHADHGTLTVRLDDGRDVKLPARYALDGHLDHGYALTAHRAQGATVDRAYVLGSDELYREWGYTALSRHRYESRFYLSASPQFLNEAPAPLHTDRDAAAQVVRTLDGSRAEHLALTHHHRDPRLDRRDRDQHRLDELDRRRDALHQQRERTARFRRGALAAIDRDLETVERQRDHCQHALAETDKSLRERPAIGPPQVLPAAAPLRDLPTDRDTRPLNVRPARDLADALGGGPDLGL
ncbi:MobF family relaxase [Paraconexibacter sp.]|uniref:MobF family relaxase n=1 Tax=Paraconexibacter sp. TaxID=2949640 RepID=UPI00356495A2